MSLDRMVADPQNGGHAFAGGHQVGIGDAQPGPARRVQRGGHQRLHRDVPVAIARREPPGEVTPLGCGQLAQLGFRRVGGLLRQGAAQRIGRYTGGDIPHPGAADLGVHPEAKGHGQQNGLPAALQMPHHVAAPQDAGFGQRLHLRPQPDGAGRRSGQQRYGAALQQGHGGGVRLPARAEIPRCLRKVDLLRFFHRQGPALPQLHLRFLLAFLK